ncbi:hypothetical protein ACFVW5_04895 [Streptomyces sp. NPDC058232]|uniref:hypothetical protein n=1 Tax=Streptomyces sp. NPDC058232 TaxID=3346393 RepID=UPI0036E56320
MGHDETSLRLNGTALLGVAGAVTGAIMTGFLANRSASAERETIGQSRRRLTRAEGALEEALRIQVVAGDMGTDVPRPRSDDVPPPRGDIEAEVRQRGALGLPELWEATHARLGLYHDIATGQAKKSFRNAQAAMVLGFALLVLFVVLALSASTTARVIVAGGLGAVSAALAGYVSRTFVRSQEAAATHLRSYFDQPLELSRYLAAERLIADGNLTQEQRGEVLSALVQAMVSGPSQPPADTPNAPAQAGR